VNYYNFNDLITLYPLKCVQKLVPVRKPHSLCGVLTQSLWGPYTVLQESLRSPHTVLTESLRSPQKLYVYYTLHGSSQSPYNPYRVLTESFQSFYKVLTESLQSLQTPYRLLTDSVRTL
jgi:hypothetical protein